MQIEIKKFKPKGQLFIKDQWVVGNGQLFDSNAPANQKSVWQGHSATLEDVQQAIQSARNKAYEWATTSLQNRIQICEHYAELIEKHKEEIAFVIHTETGKPYWESLTEVGAMKGKIQISIKAYHERTGFTSSENNGTTSQLIHKPHGVVAVFGPFNFPGHLPNGHIVPALIAGNTIVFKPSEQTPWTGEVLMQLWVEAGLPSGVLQLVQGAKETGVALASHQDIDGLFFTGSSTTGAALSQSSAAKLGKILALELGGNNPLIVDNIQNLEAGVLQTIQSAFLSSGQRCTCARRLIVTPFPQRDTFIKKLIHVSSEVELTLHNEDEGFMGPVINLQQARSLLERQKQLIGLGAQVLLEMKQPDPNLPYLTPGILDVTNCHSIPDEEDFGPLLKVIFTDSFESALQEANNTRYGLSAGLMADDETRWQEFQLRIRAGIVNWNKPTTGASSAAPFGGVGDSGNHNPGAYYAADYCAYPMASVYSHQLELPASLPKGISAASLKQEV